jgi:hypothetical protein
MLLCCWLVDLIEGVRDEDLGGGGGGGSQRGEEKRCLTSSRTLLSNGEGLEEKLSRVAITGLIPTAGMKFSLLIDCLRLFSEASASNFISRSESTLTCMRLLVRVEGSAPSSSRLGAGSNPKSARELCCDCCCCCPSGLR